MGIYQSERERKRKEGEKKVGIGSLRGEVEKRYAFNNEKSEGQMKQQSNNGKSKTLLVKSRRPFSGSGPSRDQAKIQPRRTALASLSAFASD